MKKYGVLALVVSALSCAITSPAADVVFYVKDGTSDWTKPENYLNNDVPGENDIVVVTNKTTVMVSSSDVASWNIVSKLKSMRPYDRTGP